MSSTVERAVLLGSSIRLQQKNFFDDFLDARLFLGEAPLRVVLGHSEPFGQEWHGSLEISLRAVMLGRKE